MTKLFKRMFAVAAVSLLLVVSIFISVSTRPANAATIDEAASGAFSDKIHTVTADELDITDGTLNGFAVGFDAADRLLILDIPASVTAVASGAFRGNSQIAIVNIPSGSTLSESNIGDDAFANCTGLVEVRTALSDPDVGYIGYGRLFYSALSVTSGNSNVTIDDAGYVFCKGTRGDAENKYYLVGYVGGDTALVLPAKADGNDYDIYDYAFYEEGAVTSVDMSGAAVKSVGRYAFYKASALKSVTFSASTENIDVSAFQESGLTSLSLPVTLKTIGDYAFASNRSLAGRVEIPSAVTAVGASAFYECAGINEIVFAGGGTADLTIGRRAFMTENTSTSRLSVVTLPARLKQMGPQAFTGAALNAVYVNSDITYVTESVAGNNVYYPGNTLLIYDTVANYAKGIKKTQLSDCVDRMTYRVNVVFTGMTGTSAPENTRTEVRLAGRGYDFVMSSDGTWATVSSTSLPVQNGYSVSVWKPSDGTAAIRSDDASGVSKLTEALDSSLRSQSAEISFTADYIAKPALTPLTVTYNGTSYSGDNLWTLVSGQDALRNYASILKISRTDGSTDALLHANNYGLTVSLNEEYGAWLTDIQLTVTIQRMRIELDSVIEWNGLSDGMLYVYQNGDDESDRVYARSQLTDAQINSIYTGKNYTFHSAVNVRNSMVDGINDSIGDPVSATVSMNDHVSFESIDYSGETQSGNGMYVALAEVTAGGDYMFVNGGTYNEYGLTVTIDPDGASAQIAKVWYIVIVGNAVYKEGTTTPYAIDGWQYKGTGAGVIDAPELGYAPSSADDFTFSLVRRGERNGAVRNDNIAAGVVVTELGNYINASMPVGVYTLTFNIPTVTANGTQYRGYATSVSFEVTPAAFEESWRSDARARLSSAAWLYNGSLQVWGHSSDTADHAVDLSVWSAFSASSPLTTARTGVWNNAQYDDLYSDRFVLTYNLDRIPDNNYYTFAELGGYSVAPRDVNSYTVYYQLSAKNYESLVDLSNDAARREYRFSVVIYRTVELPTVDDAVYNGRQQKPLIATSPYYSVDYGSRGYTNFGEYTITLTLYDSSLYRWAGITGNSSTATIKYNITRADNETIVPLHIYSWVFTEYDPDRNTITWGTMFGTADDYSYTLVSEDGEKTYAPSDFARALPGEYTLVAVCSGYVEGDVSTEDYNYNAFTDSAAVRVITGANTWEKTPSIMQWRYGGYNKDVNLITAEDKAKYLPVVFKITTDAAGVNAYPGLEEFTAEKGVVDDTVAEILSALECGTYYLCAFVDGYENRYEPLSPDPIPFEVTMAENYWITPPAISDWVQGSYAGEVDKIVAQPRFGSEIRYVINVAGSPNKVVYDSVLGINKLKDAGVGVYRLSVTVNGTDNYSDLGYSVNFNIFKRPGMPWWGVLLIVLGALAIVALVLFILHQVGVLQMLTRKFVLAIRNKATVDATVASVRARKVAEESKLSQARARAKDARKARREAIAAEKNMSVEERVAAMETEARENELRAQKYIDKAESIRNKSAALQNPETDGEAEEDGDSEEALDAEAQAELEQEQIREQAELDAQAEAELEEEEGDAEEPTEAQPEAEEAATDNAETVEEGEKPEEAATDNQVSEQPENTDDDKKDRSTPEKPSARRGKK